MLNKDNQRELAYVVRIDDITSIEGYDRVELAHVSGWTIVVGKDEFKPNDLAIYFEIDSKLPEVEPFTKMEFLAKKKYKVKTQKMCKSLSQGLLMSANNFGWTLTPGNEAIIDDTNIPHFLNDESRFLTKKLGVTYYIKEDNYRKSKYIDKYEKMIRRNSKLFSKQPYKWLASKTLGKKFLFIFYGTKSDSLKWPDWVTKTDEERIENMPWILTDKEPWIATEKIDGTSTTFTMKRGKRGKFEFYVCSRNVVFDKPDKPCFYNSNVYLEMAEQYHIESHMKDMLGVHPEWDWVTIQGETYGAGIQINDYDINEHRFKAFNLITSDKGRWNTEDMCHFLEYGYGIPCIPVLNSKYILPDTIEELREYVKSEVSTINGKLKEGIVFRDLNGDKSFKCVDPEYLIKFH